MHKVFFKMGMRADYIEIMGAMATCLKIRNLFAHCHWGQSKKRGSGFGKVARACARHGVLVVGEEMKGFYTVTFCRERPTA
jgi:hypothetical protein